MPEKLTLTRALAEIKLLDKKIESAMNKKYIGLYQKKSNNILNTVLSVEDFETEAKENFQSLKDLLERKEKIKTAISISNATTSFKIGEKTMTIAEAIGFKTAILPVMKNVLVSLKSQVVFAINEVEKFRLNLDNQITKMLEQNLGKDRKADDKSWDSIAKPFLEQNEFNVSDKAKIQDFIKDYEKAIIDFESNIDFSLSEINAKTEIEI